MGSQEAAHDDDAQDLGRVWLLLGGWSIDCVNVHMSAMLVLAHEGPAFSRMTFACRKRMGLLIVRT